MRSSLAGLALAASIASAFPMAAFEELQKRGAMDSLYKANPKALEGRAIEGRAVSSSSGTAVPDPAVLLNLFDAKTQYVSNTGKHAWVAPGPNDARGPCPGLNAMANHGYIPHSGVATIGEFIQGTYDVFGMGLDLGGFLAVYGAAFDGDVLHWSIGGPSSLVGLGATGLIGSHNKYESDVSPTRPDLYEYGNNYEVEWSQWEQLYAYQANETDETANYNLAILEDFRSKRFDQSIANNPYFFNAPFSGVIVQPAAYTFIYRFMANKSAEHPDGVLNKHVLKSFFGVTENPDGTFSGGKGYERIPDNWYKRAVGAEYTIPFFALDVIEEGLKYNKFIDIGGNTGTVNSFAGVDVQNLTFGVFNVATLLEQNNLLCYIFQLAQEARLDVVNTVLGSLTDILDKLAPAAAKVLFDLGCPQLTGIDTAQLEQFPGYKGTPNR